MSAKARKAKVGAKAKAGAKKTTRKAKAKTAPKGKKVAAKAPARKKKAAAKAAAPTCKKRTATKTAVAPKRRKKAASRASKPKKPRRVRLGPKQAERYREVLLEKQRGLTAAYQLSKGDSRSDLDDGTEDYIDYAVHSYAREFLLSLSEMDRKQLYLVDDALERLGRNEFGYCQQCQEPVHPKRLEVAPWARYCVPCQELEERGMLPDLTAAEAADDDSEAAAASGSSAGHDEDSEDSEESDDAVAAD